MKTARLAVPLFAICTLSLAAQQTRHRATPAHPTPPVATTPVVPDSPALPAGIPPANGKVETAFALRYIDIKAGDGPVTQAGQFLTVQYTGWLASDGTKFDSSVDRKEPFTFPQGARRVIPGWDGGFEGMHVGGKRRLFIPYQLAYGERGRAPVIPPKSDLIFDIELIAAGDTPPPPPPDPAPAAAPAGSSGQGAGEATAPSTPAGQQTPPAKPE